MVYRNLEPLFNSRNALKRLANNYHNLILTKQHNANVITTNSFIKISIDRIDNRLNELSYYTPNGKREKRSIADGLGTALKWLIGTPDASDAQHYEKCINLLEKQAGDTNEILNQQLQIISSTIANFNDSMDKITYDEKTINENINRINSYFNSSNNAINRLKLNEEVSSISIQILESVTSLEKEIDDIITSILFIKSGAIHPSIISTNQLFKEMISANPSKNHADFVLPIALQNMHEILESATISSYIYMNKLVFLLEFPLVRNKLFTLYNLYPIPINHPNSSLYSTIFPEQSYLATTNTLQQYALIGALDKCKIIATERRVCPEMPVYNHNTRPICELSIQLTPDKDLPTICQAITFNAALNTFQPLKNNKWIFLMKRHTTGLLECGNKTSHHDIVGNGILHVHRNPNSGE